VLCVASQRLVETHFPGNEYTCINQRVAQRLTRFVATENNRGISCLTGCSIFGPREVSSVRDSDSQREREIEFQRIEGSGWRIQYLKCYQATTKQADVEEFILFVTVILRLMSIQSTSH
jgi:hypothetical protein